MSDLTRDMAGQRIGTADGPPIQRYRVLAIGIDEYGQWNRLWNAERGAAAIAAVLHADYGFEKPVLLMGRDATRTRILEVLGQMLREGTEADALVIVFCGHGHLDPVSGVGAWIPVDGVCPRDGQIDAASATWVENASIRQRLRGSRVRHVLVLSDSCFAGDLLRGESPASVPGYIQEATRLRCRQVLASGGLHPVVDGERGGHSPFARGVLAALEDASPGPLLPGQLLDRVRRLLQASSVRQTPILGLLVDTDSEIGGEFVFFRRTAAAPGRSGRQAGTGLASRTRPAHPVRSWLPVVVAGLLVALGTLGWTWRSRSRGRDNLAVSTSTNVAPPRLVVSNALPDLPPKPVGRDATDAEAVKPDPPRPVIPEKVTPSPIDLARRVGQHPVSDPVEREQLRRLAESLRSPVPDMDAEELRQLETALHQGNTEALVRMSERTVPRESVLGEVLTARIRTLATLEGASGAALLTRLGPMLSRLAEPADSALRREVEVELNRRPEPTLASLAGWWESRQLSRIRQSVCTLLRDGAGSRPGGDPVRLALEELLRRVEPDTAENAAFLREVAGRIGAGSREELESTARWWSAQQRELGIRRAIESVRQSNPDRTRPDPDFRLRRLASDLEGSDAIRIDRIVERVASLLDAGGGRGRRELAEWYAQVFLPPRTSDVVLVLEAESARHQRAAIVAETLVTALQAATGGRRKVRWQAGGVPDAKDVAEEAALLGTWVVGHIRIRSALVDGDRSEILDGTMVHRAVVDVEVTGPGRTTGLVLKHEFKEIREIGADELVRKAIEKGLKGAAWPGWLLNPAGP